MIESPPKKGPNLPRDQRKKNVSLSDLARRFQRFIKSGWGKWLVETKWPLALLIAFVVALLVSPHIDVSLYRSTYRVGDYTKKAIKAPREISIEDIDTTRSRREEAASKVWSVYDYAPSMRAEAEKKVIVAFNEARDFFSMSKSSAQNGDTPTAKIIPKSEVTAVKRRFLKALGITLSDKEMLQLQKIAFSKYVQDLTATYVKKAMGNRIVGNRKFLLDEMAGTGRKESRGITVRNLDDEKETELMKFEDILELEDAYKFLDNLASKNDALLSGKLALTIAKNMVQPNLTFNKSESELRKRLMREQVAPLVTKFQKNQLIVGEGVRITEDTLKILNQLREQHNRREAILVFFSITAFSFLFLIMLYRFADKNIAKFRITPRDLLFLASFICLSVVMIQLCMVIVQGIADQFESLTPTILFLAIPVACATMIVRFLLNSETAVIFAVLISTFSGMIVDPTMTTATYFLASSLVGAHFMAKVSQRITILKAGLFTGLFNMVAILTLRLALSSGEGVVWLNLLFAMIFALMGGVFSGLVVLAITPIIEWLFGYTSNIKLLELTSLNHPLLKGMVFKAPGTYNHSTLVSGLAEGAAEAIGCNALLAKVAALYHDIGKANKPEYFVENLGSGQDNKHDSLFPRMSGLILTSHVKEGVEMARRHNLGGPIVDIIQQHHGTSLIYFFYNRAKKREDPEMSLVEESDFRYPGPRPRSREAAIVMLADIAEASSRSLTNPTPTRIRQNVEDMVERAFLDGQLNECELTLKDLEKIARNFTVILTGIFHTRIQYPDQENREEQIVDNDPDSRPPKSDANLPLRLEPDG